VVRIRAIVVLLNLDLSRSHSDRASMRPGI
jgi:hypothetical protein